MVQWIAHQTEDLRSQVRILLPNPLIKDNIPTVVYDSLNEINGFNY